jgi:DNA-binding transcriptional LysR family regulator
MIPQHLERHRIVIPARRHEISFTHWTFSRRDDRQVVIVPANFIDRDGSNLARAAVAAAGIIRVFEVSARVFLKQGALVRVLEDWSCGALPIYAVLPSGKNVPGKVRAFVLGHRSDLQVIFARGPTRPARSRCGTILHWKRGLAMCASKRAP